MISRFINLFKKTDGDERRAFQSRVLAILRELHPDKKSSISDNPLALNFDEQLFGLTNIRSNFLLTSKTDNDLRTIVADHIENALTGLDVADRENRTWDKARPDLLPQLMPAEFLDKFQLVSFPFGRQIVLGFVIDAEKTYSYVSKGDMNRWDVTELEIYDSAFENLSERSNGIEATQVPGPNGLLVVNTLDGFDAVRIASNELRRQFGETLGLPFYFGVPNRDFLICWAKNDDMEFQGRMRSQISQDFDERPYPLSPSVFEANENGEVKQVEAVTVDPRAASAESN